VSFIIFVSCFSLTQMSVFLSRYVVFNITFSFLILLGLLVLMFPRRKSTREVNLFLHACPNVSLEDIAVLVSCSCERGPSLTLLVLVVVSGAVSLSQFDVSFKILNVSVLTCIFVFFPIITFVFDFSSSDHEFHFHQVILVAFVVDHVVC